MRLQYTGIALCIFWILLSIFPYTAFQLQRNRCRRQNFKQINLLRRQDEAVTLTFNAWDDIPWIVEGKELLYQERLYDILSISNAREGIHLYCVPDRVQDSLRIHYLQRYAHAIPYGQASSQSLSVISQDLVKCIGEHWWRQVLPGSVRCMRPPWNQTILQDIYQEIATPPPEVLYA